MKLKYIEISPLEPKALIIPIQVACNQENTRWFEIKKAIIDTGASYSAISRFYLSSSEKIYEESISERNLIGWGYRDTSVICIKIFEHVFKVEASVLEEEEVGALFIIGRDILNAIRLDANGLKNEFELIFE